MTLYNLKKEKISDFLNEIRKKYMVFAPVKNDGITAFKKLKNEKIPEIVLQRTDKPPKEIFFPQTEALFSFEDNKIQSADSSEKPIAVFGVTPCDTKSILILDRVFMDSRYTDTYWSERRKNSLIFTISCNVPRSTCFCNWFNCGPFSSNGSDVLMIDIGDDLLLEPQNEFAANYLARIEILEKAGKKESDLAEKLKKKAELMMPDAPELNNLKCILDNSTNDEIFEENAAKCLACGVCSFSCPTCYCFDIQDESRRNKGRRIRVWDTCQVPLFTKEGSGHNPRPSQKERQRQRFMHKLSYMIETQDDFGCVGCGRCVNFCPVNIDIRDFIKRVLLSGDKK